MYKTFVSILHCALENGADLYVNERHKIRHYRASSSEERRRKKNAKSRFFYFARCICKIALSMLYTDSIGNQPWNTMVVFKMRDSVPSVRYSSVCNVLRLGRILLIPTYRIYLLRDKQFTMIIIIYA